MNGLLKAIGVMAALVFSALAHIYVAQQAWNMFMPVYGFNAISYKQAWLYGVVFASMSGSSRISMIIKKEAKEELRVLIGLGILAPFFELLVLHIIHYFAF